LAMRPGARMPQLNCFILFFSCLFVLIPGCP
jgi:hypothetical protein